MLVLGRGVPAAPERASGYSYEGHAIAIGSGLIGLLLPTWMAAIVELEAKEWFVMAALAALVFMLCALALAICLGLRMSSQSRAWDPASPKRAAAAATRRTNR